MSITEFDQLNEERKKQLLKDCCDCTSWIKKMSGIFPVQNLVDLLEYAEEEWYDCNAADWLETFNHQKPITQMNFIEEELKNDSSTHISNGSKKKISNQEMELQLNIAAGLYEKTFGYHFVFFRTTENTGKILNILNRRLKNDGDKELHIAAGEQNKITQSKLQQLFAD